MRVLQVMAGAEFGGAEAFFVRLVIALHKAGLKQRVVVRKNERRAQILRDAGIAPVELKFGGRFDLATSRTIKKHLREFQPHVALSWMNRATLKMPKRRTSDLNAVFAARLGGYYDLKYYRHCDHLIGNTRDICDYLVREGWPIERTHYLPNFVVAQQSDPIDRAALNIPERARFILALGRLHENKAFDTLVRALGEMPEIYLVIAGEGPQYDALMALATNSGVRPRIRMLGWRDDIAALLGACDVFVCPSRHEPLGNVVIEAWAQGRPVVATMSDGPKVLIRDGQDGLLTPIDDAPAMADAIKKVLGDDMLADDLGLAGRRRFEAEFTEARIVKQYLDFFQGIAV